MISRKNDFHQRVGTSEEMFRRGPILRYGNLGLAANMDRNVGFERHCVFVRVHGCRLDGLKRFLVVLFFPANDDEDCRI